MEKESHEQGEPLRSVMSSFTTGSYNDQWDLGTKHEVENEPNFSEHSQAILNTLQEMRRSHDIGWLNELTTELKNIHRANTVHQGSENYVVQERTIQQWLDKLFDEFELFSTEFNSTDAGRECFVNCYRPGPRVVSEYQGDSSSSDALQEYEGYLSTLTWAMLLRASNDRLVVFIIPAEALLGFRSSTLGENDFPASVEIKRGEDPNSFWEIDGQPIGYDDLGTLAEELFSGFVRVVATAPSELASIVENLKLQ